MRLRTTRTPCLANPSFCTDRNYTTDWSAGSIRTKGCFRYGRFDFVVASINTNAWQGIVFGGTHSRNPW